MDTATPTKQDAGVVSRGDGPGEADSTLYVVGVGASAGGLEALERTFRNVPADTGAAFCVVQHLSPAHPSMMGPLLAKWTAMPVLIAEDRARLEPDHVYLLPPGKEMIVSDGRLLLTDREADAGLSLPIDLFFGSLGRDRGRHAVAVILSGTGSDGSRGVRHVREHGGLVLCQTEDSAEFDGMPRSTHDSGAAHLLLPPERIGGILGEYFECRDIDSLVERAEPDSPDGTGLARVFGLLNDAYGIDFGDYKLSTVARRTERRILLGRCDDLPAYVRRLEQDPEELSRLYHDLLIGVTEFFRDPQVWETLGEHLDGILEAKPDGEEVRAWSAGCAAGPEAYTVAILLHERLRKLGRELPVKLFATDVHRESLEAAGYGEYDVAALEKVPGELRERYFLPPEGDRVRVRPELRRCVVFSPHNVVKDAPFTRLDLITCRNMLIYLQQDAQRKAVALFHFGLRTGGLMLMGSSETPGELREEFESVAGAQKLYRKRRNARLPGRVRVPPGGQVRGGEQRTVQTGGRTNATDRRLALTVPTERRRIDDRMGGYYDALLSEFIPPALLIDAEHRLLHKFGGAGVLLNEPDGRQSDDVFRRLDPDLRVTVVGGFQRALRNGEQVAFRGVNVTLGDERSVRRILFKPVTLADEDVPSAVLILFEPDDRAAAEPDAAGDPSAAAGAASRRSAAEAEELGGETNARNLQLQEELDYTRDNLQALVEELEATNEELIASNEEMQSTNEELNSVNEELYTHNGEYQAKIRELTELSADVENLLRSTGVHTVFLDGELCVRKFTPRAAELFNLMPHDVGRPFDSFRHRTDAADLPADLRRVLETGTLLEREVNDLLGVPHLLRVLPYRADGSIEGVVVTLVDVSALREAERKFHVALEASGRAMVLADGDGSGKIVLATRAAEDLFRAGRGTLVGRPFAELLSPHDLSRVLASSGTDRAGDGADPPAAVPQRVKHRDMTARRTDGGTFNAAVGVARVDVEDGRFLLATFEDVTDRNRLRTELRRKEHELQAVLENSGAAIYLKDPDGKYLLVNSFLAELSGRGKEAMLGKTDHDVWPKEFADRFRAHDTQILRTGRPIEFEEVVEVDGAVRTYVSLKFPVFDDAGQVIATGGVSSDITVQKEQTARAEAALSQRDTFLAMLSHELRNPLAAITGGLRMLDRAGDGSSPDSPSPNGDAQRAWVDEMVRRQVGQLSHLIDDLLDVSRVSRGTLQIRREWLDLRSVARAARDTVAEQFVERDQRLELDVAGGVVAVEGDEHRLAQVAVNLLTNAARYGRNGGRAVLSVFRDGDEAVLRVTDDGCGLTADALGRVFELFGRADDSADRAAGGLGVGLTLVRRFAELHDGTVTAESDGPDAGSTFTVRLPATDAEPPPVPVDLPPPVLTPKRMLVVDDNRDLARGMAAFLRGLGHAVRVESDGPAGLAAAREDHPEVCLLDLGLPGLTGLEIAAALRSDRAFDRTPLLAVSGYGQDKDRRRSAEAGFDAHLTKPVDYDDLLRRIARTWDDRNPPASVMDAEAVMNENVEDAPTVGRVLVIEDNRSMRVLLERMVKSLGAEVASAADGDEGLRRADEFRPDVVLCDLSLPGGVDGCDVARALTARRRDADETPPRMYAVSAHDGADWQSRTRDAGFADLLEKPVSLERLRDVLATA